MLFLPQKSVTFATLAEVFRDFCFFIYSFILFFTSKQKVSSQIVSINELAETISTSSWNKSRGAWRAGGVPSRSPHNALTQSALYAVLPYHNLSIAFFSFYPLTIVHSNRAMEIKQ